MVLESNLSRRSHVKGTGKKKIEVKAIQKEDQRMVTFSKRRRGLVKKAKAYTRLKEFWFTVIVFSPNGKPYHDENREILDIYRNFVKENILVQWLKDMQLEDYDDAEKLSYLKEKLRETKEKVAKKLSDMSSS